TERLAMLQLVACGDARLRLQLVARWLIAWERHEPVFDHLHLGPAAVDRSRQGQGIGIRLMIAVCERLDGVGGVGYLVTDKPGNVRLYRRGGFEVIGAQPVLGVPNWFMLRQPAPAHPPPRLP